MWFCILYIHQNIWETMARREQKQKQRFSKKVNRTSTIPINFFIFCLINKDLGTKLYRQIPQCHMDIMFSNWLIIFEIAPNSLPILLWMLLLFLSSETPYYPPNIYLLILQPFLYHVLEVLGRHILLTLSHPMFFKLRQGASMGSNCWMNGRSDGGKNTMM